MIDVQVFGESTVMEAVAESLDAIEGVTRVTVVGATRVGHSVVSASADPRRVDAVLEELRTKGVPESDVTLARVDVVGKLPAAEPSLVWADVIGTAWLNARPLARYLMFMLIAGVIGGYGVIDDNVILIVGAMALAPDLLPITAVAVGLVDRQATLASRAFLTVAVGLGAACLAAATSAFIQDHFDLIPSSFDIHETGVLGGLTSVNNETIAVALVAGVAGMLALETRAASAVGVAISVTTIPAAAYVGVAAGVGELDNSAGALEVLGMNVAMMVLGAVGTLITQRLLMRRAVARRTRLTHTEPSSHQPESRSAPGA
jgi:uncharacterized hydrophobic protein (TIGR00271 family)